MSNFFFIIKLILLFVFNNNIFANQVENKILNSEKHAIPKILSDSDLKLYKNIINFQSLAQWNDADKTLRKVDKKFLNGYFDYNKLMHPNKYKASYNELLEWLIKYDDFPAVMKRRVFRLMKIRAKNESQIHKYEYPKYGNYLRGYGEATYYKDSKLRPNKAFNIRQEKTNLSKLVLENKYKKIAVMLKNNLKFQELRVSLIKPLIDKTYYSGNIKSSFKLYKSVISAISYEDSELLFRAGVNAYRLGHKNYANECFKKCAYKKYMTTSLNTEWLIASCSYWLARAKNKATTKNSLFKKAANYPRTLYGQLALEKLNVRNTFNWESNIKPSAIDHEKIYNNLSFQRMIALTELKLYNEADLELRNLYSKLGNQYIEPLYYLSEKLDLAAAQMRLGSKFYKLNKVIYMRGLYPTPNWNLESGYILDKALLFALIRRESAFNIKAKSSKGARGLMQLMPRTASKIKKDYRLRYGNVHKLYSLQLNLELGQKFLKRLIHNPNTNNSLLDTLIAYNAGMSRLKNWKKSFDGDDPLLFIESIPIKETRWFVKYILTDLWIYRDKMQQEKPTRTLLADEKWPKYKNIDFIYSRDAKIR